MELVIDSTVIETPIIDILKDIRLETSGRFLREIIPNGNNVRVTCPWHKDGMESHGSCDVYCSVEGDLVCGTVHCFTCGKSKNLISLSARCLGMSYENAKNWLVERYGGDYRDGKIIEFADEIQLHQQEKVKEEREIDLSKYDYYHPYMWKRGLSKDVVDKFRIGYNKDRDTITFPVWDEFGKIVMVTERSVNSKKFYIEEGVEKPVYLLNFIEKWRIDKVIVTESQINCLTAWRYGYPAIALFGTGSEHQLEILNRSGIKSYILMFDGDKAGREGARRFKKGIKKSVFVKDIQMPFGKDVNDLSGEEFKKLLEN